MICILALIVFSILGIFSVSYRRLAYEAFDCVFRRLTLRKCESALDVRLKSQIVGKLLKLNHSFALIVYNYFEVFSWTLVILTLISGYYTGLAGYNYAMYGNCNGPEGGFCIFDPSSTSAQYSTCGDAPENIFRPDVLTKPKIFSTDPYIGPDDAKVTVIQFGCYVCPYTKESQEVFDELVDTYKDRVKFVYLDFPLASHPGSQETAKAAECAREQNQFWQYHYQLFELREYKAESLIELAQDLHLDMAKFNSCYADNDTTMKIDNDFRRGISSGVKGTPTFFVNDQAYTGNIKYDKLKDMIEEELAK